MGRCHFSFGLLLVFTLFTKDAIDFAKTNNILILDGKELPNSIRSYAILEGQPEKKTRKLQKSACAFVGLLFVVVCYFWLYPESSTSFYSILPSQIKAFIPNSQEYHDEKNTKISMPNQQTEQKGEKQNFLYEIELFSGGRISTDNIIITKNEITFKSDKGLIVSLNREEIKSMKKTKLDN